MYLLDGEDRIMISDALNEMPVGFVQQAHPEKHEAGGWQLQCVCSANGQQQRYGGKPG